MAPLEELLLNRLHHGDDERTGNRQPRPGHFGALPESPLRAFVVVDTLRTGPNLTTNLPALPGRGFARAPAPRGEDSHRHGPADLQADHARDCFFIEKKLRRKAVRTPRLGGMGARKGKDHLDYPRPAEPLPHCDIGPWRKLSGVPLHDFWHTFQRPTAEGGLIQTSPLWEGLPSFHSRFWQAWSELAISPVAASHGAPGQTNPARGQPNGKIPAAFPRRPFGGVSGSLGSPTVY